jgi:hypothetical protein
MPLRRHRVPTVVLPGLIVLLGALCGCAARPQAAEPQVGSQATEERPEPLPKGVKPLTVEQEEMIQP